MRELSCEELPHVQGAGLLFMGNSVSMGMTGAMLDVLIRVATRNSPLATSPAWWMVKAAAEGFIIGAVFGALSAGAASFSLKLEL